MVGNFKYRPTIVSENCFLFTSFRLTFCLIHCGRLSWPHANFLSVVCLYR